MRRSLKCKDPALFGPLSLCGPASADRVLSEFPLKGSTDSAELTRDGSCDPP